MCKFSYSLSAANSDEWMPIPGYDHYLISKNGQILSFSKDRFGKVHVNQMVTNKVNQNGYCMVCLTNNKERRVVQMGRLMLECFDPRDDMDSLDCDHIDSNRANNKLSNLQWITHKENVHKREKRFIHNRGKAIVVFWTDGTVTAYAERKHCPIPVSTMTHLLNVNLENGQFYSGSSKKYGVERAFFVDEVPPEYQKRMGVLSNADK